MKKTALFLGIIMLLTITGCSGNSAENTKSEPDFVLELDSIAEAGQTEATNETPSSEASFESVSEVETEFAETEATQTEIQETEESTSPETSEETQETTDSANSSKSLIGKWQYPDGYCLQFFEGDTVELSIDYSWVMNFQGQNLMYMDQECPITVSGNTVTAKQGDETILQMTAISGADASTLNGRFLLESCQIYDNMILDGEEHMPVYYVELQENGEVSTLIMPSKYEVSEGVLRMIDHETIMDFTYEIHDDTLEITDETGAQDILTRAE